MLQTGKNSDASAPKGRIAENIMHFGRVLRAAGLPCGTGAVLKAIEAVEAVGLGAREDLYWTLHAAFVTAHEQKPVFDQAFHIFWRNPKLLERVTSLILPQINLPPDDAKPAPGAARIAEAMAKSAGNRPEPEDDEDVEIDFRFTYSETEVLQDKDFEQMTASELAAARNALRRLALPLAEVKTRRFAATERGSRIDMRRSLRATLRMGGQVIALRHRKAQRKPPPLVVIADISGSMGQYTRLFLHFVHGVMASRRQTHVFLFGTRLTNITRQLRTRDVDEALEKVAGAVQDWSGGTRIATSFAEFNRDWSRRVLGQGAVVLLLTDGLERDLDGSLAGAMDRLHRSCRRLIWLNPLLRYDKFKPRASGIKAMLPHVDDFRPVHSLASIADLVEALDASADKPGVRAA
ncbi:Carbon monoxide oxidation accessory protein CoxE [hydrothermal vent metagenome]|uniref:Carbon monoxide oxidation accessory protein CoxE n=1 Tax=hydrothermal vent metagenome TaxID=652676 RepID=A0A3B0TE83_9ZZZZ